jgi:hypothetical protein
MTTATTAIGTTIETTKGTESSEDASTSGSFKKRMRGKILIEKWQAHVLVVAA